MSYSGECVCVPRGYPRCTSGEPANRLTLVNDSVSMTAKLAVC